MTLNLNQFSQSAIQGQLDQHGFGSNVISCEISTAETATLVPGDAIKLEDSAGGVPKVLKATADSDSIFGFIVYNLKDASFTAGKRVEVAIRGSVMYMTSSAAIARGAAVEVVTATSKVKTWAGTNVQAGIAFDQAGAANALIRVYIDVPGNYISLLSLPTMLPITNKLIWVDQNRTDSYTADGTQIRPYKTLKAAVDAATEGCTIMLPCDTYTLTAAISSTLKGLRFKGIGAAGDTGAIITSASNAGFDLMTFTPAAASGDVEFVFENVYVKVAALANSGIVIDNTNVAQKVKIKGVGCIVESTTEASFTGYGIKVVRGDTSKAVQIKWQGVNKAHLAHVWLPVKLSTDGLEIRDCELIGTSGAIGAIKTGTTSTAGFFSLIWNCTIAKTALTLSGDGHSTHEVKIFGCFNFTDYAVAAAGDSAGSQTATIKNLS